MFTCAELKLAKFCSLFSVISKDGTRGQKETTRLFWNIVLLWLFSFAVLLSVVVPVVLGTTAFQQFTFLPPFEFHQIFGWVGEWAPCVFLFVFTCKGTGTLHQKTSQVVRISFFHNKVLTLPCLHALPPQWKVFCYLYGQRVSAKIFKHTFGVQNALEHRTIETLLRSEEARFECVLDS